MRIAVDIDDCLAESGKFFVSILNRLFNLSLEESDITDYDFRVSTGLEEHDLVRFWNKLKEDESWLEIEPASGSRELMEYLKAHHEPVVLTSRPDSLRSVTAKWLQKHSLDGTPMVYSNRGSKLEAAIRSGLFLELLIDDCYDFALEFALAGIPVLLIDKPWNRNKPEHPLIRRISGLEEARKILMDMDSKK